VTRVRAFGASGVDVVAIEAAVARVRPYTMAGDASLVSLGHLANRVLAWGLPGDFVECGVWRGGASFLMAELLRIAGVEGRKVWLFDSFEGLPEPQAVDGTAAFEYARSKDDVTYFDNCTASYEEVEGNALELGLRPYLELVRGWFEQTLPQARARVGPIAILRVDCDWYSGTRCVLENFYDLVSEGGFVVLDDYHAYEGSALAVHEFLAERRLPHRLESVIGFRRGGAYSESAYFRKVTDASDVPRGPQPPAARLDVRRLPTETS
jgi:O-methyltransferase